MRISVFIVSLLLPFLLNAQSFLSMTEEGQKWSEVRISYTYGMMDSSAAMRIFEVTGDTTIMGIAYRSLTLNGGSPAVFLREDTTLGKVYYRADFADEESLFFDYNYNEGDTIDDLFYIPVAPEAERPSVVASVNSIFFFGAERRVFDISIKRNVASQDDMLRWIEGIGPDRGLMYGGNVWSFPESNYFIACVRDVNDDTLYYDPADWYDCDSLLEDVNSNPIYAETQEQFSIRVYPNPVPANQTIYIEGHDLLDTRISITTIDGRELYRVLVNDNDVRSIQFPEMEPGSYLLILSSSSFFKSQLIQVVK
jgi:hypothetical protein